MKRKIPGSNVEVRSADSARPNRHTHLTGARIGYWAINEFDGARPNVAGSSHLPSFHRSKSSLVCTYTVQIGKTSSFGIEQPIDEIHVLHQMTGAEELVAHSSLRLHPHLPRSLFIVQ